jgi:hypothetical protein
MRLDGAIGSSTGEVAAGGEISPSAAQPTDPNPTTSIPLVTNLTNRDSFARLIVNLQRQLLRPHVYQAGHGQPPNKRKARNPGLDNDAERPKPAADAA